MKPPKASAITMAFDYSIGDIRDFLGDVLEDANDHLVAHALWSLNAGDADLACKFIRLANEIEEVGELTPELRKKENELLDEFQKLQEEEGDEDED